MGIHKQELGHRHMPGNHVCHVVVGDTMVSKHCRRDHKESDLCRQTGCEFISHVRPPLGEHPTWLYLQLNRNFRFGSLTGASYASPALDTTNLLPEQAPKGNERLWRPSPEKRILGNWRTHTSMMRPHPEKPT